MIDRDKGEVVATWSTGLAFGNFPVALDENNHRLFVGCRFPSQFVVLDTESGRQVAKIDISGDSDDVFYDSKRYRIYAICGAGKIDIIEQTDANNYKALTKIATGMGRAQDSSRRKETICLSPFRVAGRIQRRFAVITSISRSQVFIPWSIPPLHFADGACAIFHRACNELPKRWMPLNSASRTVFCT